MDLDELDNTSTCSPFSSFIGPFLTEWRPFSPVNFGHPCFRTAPHIFFLERVYGAFGGWNLMNWIKPVLAVLFPAPSDLFWPNGDLFYRWILGTCVFGWHRSYSPWKGFLVLLKDGFGCFGQCQYLQSFSHLHPTFFDRMANFCVGGFFAPVFSHGTAHIPLREGFWCLWRMDLVSLDNTSTGSPFPTSIRPFLTEWRPFSPVDFGHPCFRTAPQVFFLERVSGVFGGWIWSLWTTPVLAVLFPPLSDLFWPNGDLFHLWILGTLTAPLLLTLKNLPNTLSVFYSLYSGGIGFDSDSYSHLVAFCRVSWSSLWVIQLWNAVRVVPVWGSVQGSVCRFLECVRPTLHIYTLDIHI